MERETELTLRATDFEGRYVDCGELVWVLQYLETHPPITEAYIVLNGRKSGAWWTSQREHLLCHFGSRTSWCFGDQDEPDSSAQAAFDAMNRPEMYLYLAEALGEAGDTMEKTAREVAAAGDYRDQLVRARELVTWPRIVKLLRATVASLVERGKLLKAVPYLVR